MLLTSGARLGPYEIVAPLGAGGMGEVYKARDTRLDRTVAIKILPAAVAHDPQRRERFRREARAISSLTHPHICTLHDIGEHDGAEFLVMEYLQGETLAHRLLRGAMPLDDVLRIAVQLADALDVAHRAGLIHRDLKPSNVMLTVSGAKILDFGLAKWQSPDSDAAIAAALATAPSTLTQTGMVVGTIQYMAPEQVEGKAADARSDLFALGAIVYEMTTGRKAFEGTSSASVMAAILSSMPAPMATVQRVTPAALDRVVRKCLTKDPARRWQTAADLRDELQWVEEDVNARTLAASTGGVTSTVPIAARARRRILLAISALAVLAVTIFVAASLRRVPPEARPTRLLLMPPENVTFGSIGSDVGTMVALSPDGRQVAFAALASDGRSALWVRSLEELTTRRLPGTDGASLNSPPFWSPDSRSLGFFADGSLKRIDLSGGLPRVVCGAQDGRGGSWNGSGEIIFAATFASGLYRVSADGGTPVPITKLVQQLSHRWPMFLPGGRRFLYLAQSHEKTPEVDRRRGLFAGSLDSSDSTQLLTIQDLFSNVAYAQPGYVLYVNEGNLLARRFDPSRLEFTGPAVSVATQVAYGMGRAYANFSVSANGVLAYGNATSVDTQLRWFDRTGRPLGAVGSAGQQSEPALSPDASRVAIARTDASARKNDKWRGPNDIWLVRVSDGAASRFTFDRADEFAPVWSPDGKQLVWGASWSLEHVGIFRKSADGSGRDERIFPTNNAAPTGWSPDGRFIIYEDGGATTRTDLWALPQSGDRKPLPLVQTEGDDVQGQVSPDGRWLAYSSNVSGRWEVYVQPFLTREEARAAPSGNPSAAGTAPRIWGLSEDSGGRWQVSTAGGVQPRWSHDGTELFYLAADRRLMSMRVTAMAGRFEAEVPRPLFAVAVRQYDGPYAYAVAPDNKRFLVDVPVSEGDRSLVVVLNWAADLRRQP
jgi:Tol biopolymer transport system component/aminoglycoside phosphotransferase (APT) family kinase protein